MTSRRGALTLAAGAFASAGIIAGTAATVAGTTMPGPDAELIAIGQEATPLIAEHDRLTTIWWSLGDDDREAVTACGKQMAQPFDRICELADRATALRASTLEGLRVKAMLIRIALEIEHGTEDGLDFDSSTAEATWSLVQDMLRLERA